MLILAFESISIVFCKCRHFGPVQNVVKKKVKTQDLSFRGQNALLVKEKLFHFYSLFWKSLLSKGAIVCVFHSSLFHFYPPFWKSILSKGAIVCVCYSSLFHFYPPFWKSSIQGCHCLCMSFLAFLLLSSILEKVFYPRVPWSYMMHHLGKS